MSRIGNNDLSKTQMGVLNPTELLELNCNVDRGSGIKLIICSHLNKFCKEKKFKSKLVSVFPYATQSSFFFPKKITINESN